VKIGETWSPDLDLVAKAFMGQADAAAVDMKKSSAKFTLTSVQSREGKEFGKIQGVFELFLTKMGPITLDPSLPLKFALDMDVCIDGKAQEGELKMTAAMKGKSAVAMPNGETGTLELEMASTGELRRAPVK
jgi:hypothetical protein